MRKLYFLLPLLFVLACSKPAAEAQGTTTAPPAESGDVSEADRETATEAPFEPSKEGEAAILAGEIDFIPFVMALDISSAGVKGHYFYTKQGKRIEISGTFDPGEGSYSLTEMVGGKATGYFEVLISETTMSGTWRAKKGQGDALEVTATRLNVPYEPDGALGKRISGRYSTTHPVSDMADENANETQVTDYMAVRYIGGGYFSFYLNVVGANYHTGEVSGLGKMKNDTHAVSEKEDCDLSFTFSPPGSVDITENDCDDYHGARASFDVALSR
jgi:hypothetical protein